MAGTYTVWRNERKHLYGRKWVWEFDVRVIQAESLAAAKKWAQDWCDHARTIDRNYADELAKKGLFSNSESMRNTEYKVMKVLEGRHYYDLRNEAKSKGYLDKDKISMAEMFAEISLG